jgi:hypothetical protein
MLQRRRPIPFSISANKVHLAGNIKNAKKAKEAISHGM